MEIGIMKEENNDKIIRVLQMYAKLMDGQSISKTEEARKYGVDERSIQRDIEDVRRFLDVDTERTGDINSLVYDRADNLYRLEQDNNMHLTNSEILAICKILLDSRAFTKVEMDTMLDKLLECCVPAENRKKVKELIGNEKYHYIEPRHKTVFVDKMWDIGQAISEHKYIKISYYRLKDKQVVERKIRPVAIMFSEYYFYVTAFIDDEEVRSNFDVVNDVFPTIYRIDRIKEMEVLEEHFHVPYKDRFQEGEFRKRIQFMYGGKLRKVRFKYLGKSVEAILDRLPTAKIISEEDGIYLISAEVFGDGIDMWIKSQGKNIILE